MRRDAVNTAIIWFVLTFIAELLLPLLNGVIFPPAAAQEALVSDDSFRLLLILGTPVFTFVVTVMGYSLVHFRARGGELECGAPIRTHDGFASAWLLITGGLCVMVIIHPGLTGLAKFQGNPNADLVVQVTARQWAWDVAYPAFGIGNVSELVLPAGRRVKFEVTSADVLHSFWIPAFRDKIDAVPGRQTMMYITPNEIASFEDDFNLRVQCTEICGIGHAGMSMPVRLVSTADFDTWAQTQSALAKDPIARGKAVAKAKGCAACHSTDGTKIVGPSWLDLFNHDVPLADGTTVKADEAYIRESILNPNAKIVKGFEPNLMPPNFGQTLSAREIDDLVAYIKSLGK